MSLAAKFMWSNATSRTVVQTCQIMVFMSGACLVFWPERLSPHCHCSGKPVRPCFSIDDGLLWTDMLPLSESQRRTMRCGHLQVFQSVLFCMFRCVSIKSIANCLSVCSLNLKRLSTFPNAPRHAQRWWMNNVFSGEIICEKRICDAFGSLNWAMSENASGNCLCQRGPNLEWFRFAVCLLSHRLFESVSRLFSNE